MTYITFDRYVWCTVDTLTSFFRFISSACESSFNSSLYCSMHNNRLWRSAYIFFFFSCWEGDKITWIVVCTIKYDVNAHRKKRETQKTHQSLVIVGLSSLVTHWHRLHTTLITCECIFICTAFFSTPLSNPIGLLWCVFVILSAKQQEKTNNIEIGLVCFFPAPSTRYTAFYSQCVFRSMRWCVGTVNEL